MTELLERVAGAPITWGVCEVPGWGQCLAPDRVLSEMAGIGLRATELGPEGYLPDDPGQVRTLLAAHGLELVAGFLPVVLHVREALDERLPHVAAYADLLAGAGADVLVLAASTAGDRYEGRTSAALDRDGWDALVHGIGRVMDVAGERGLTVALHPHHGTLIVVPADIGRVLQTSPVPLCVDTGHLVIGGSDPLEVIRSAGDRVAHVHLKDADAALAERVRGGRLGYADAVRAGMYRPLGEGDLDIAAVVRTLEASGYRGWFVLEQDTVLERAPRAGTGPVHHAGVSLEFLRRLGSEMERDVPVGVAGRARAAHEATSRGKEEG